VSPAKKIRGKTSAMYILSDEAASQERGTLATAKPLRDQHTIAIGRRVERRKGKRERREGKEGEERQQKTRQGNHLRGASSPQRRFDRGQQKKGRESKERGRKKGKKGGEKKGKEGKKEKREEKEGARPPIL
jgi:hypothetical protein